MTLPANDLEYLGERSTGHQVAAEANMTCVVFPGFQTNTRHVRRERKPLPDIRSMDEAAIRIHDRPDDAGRRAVVHLSLRGALPQRLFRHTVPGDLVFIFFGALPILIAVRLGYRTLWSRRA